MSEKRRRTKAHDMAVAYHEAGHAIAACYIKGAGTIRRITIEPGEDCAGEVVNKWLLKGADPEFNMTARDRVSIEREIMVSLAGPIAQRKFNPRSERHYHGASDRYKAFNLACYVHAGNIRLPFTSSEAFLKWLSLCTVGLVAVHWPEIEALAEELLTRRKMTGKELGKWLNQWYDDESKRASESRRLARERNEDVL